MSFVGLDFGKSANTYAQLLKEAYLNRQQQDMQDRAFQYQNYEPLLYDEEFMGTNVVNPDFESPGMNDFVPPPNIEPEELSMVPFEEVGREPGSVEETVAKAKSMGPGASVTAPITDGRSIDQKAADMASAKAAALDAGLGAPPFDPKPYDDEIRRIVTAAHSQGMVKNGMIHKSIAAQINAIQKAKFDAMKPRGNNPIDALIAQLAKPQAVGSVSVRTPPPPRAPAPARSSPSPVLGILEKQLSRLQADAKNDRFNIMTGNTTEREVQERKERMDRIFLAQASLASGAITPQEALAAAGIGSPTSSTQPQATPPRKELPKRVEYKGKTMTGEEWKKRHPEAAAKRGY